jgi:L-amino acid N-acyltransferase YncA
MFGPTQLPSPTGHGPAMMVCASSQFTWRDGGGRGFGRAALGALIDEAKNRGWWKLLSRVFPENLASRKLCTALGFREVGIYEKHARLDGKWMDTVIVEKLLA